MKQMISVLVTLLVISHHGLDACFASQDFRQNNLELYRLNLEVDEIKELLKSMISRTSESAEREEKREEAVGVPMFPGSHSLSKRSPRCIRTCLEQRLLHPAQCHSYCRFQG